MGDTLVFTTPPTPKGTTVDIFKSCYDGSCSCVHYVGGMLSQLKPCRFVVWIFGQGSIVTDDDKTLFAGIVDGFDLVSSDVEPYECHNYTSVTDPPNNALMSEILTKELANGFVSLADTKPVCVHALGAVPKQGGGIRPITDCSRPQGCSVNDHMQGLTKDFSMKSVDDVSNLLLEGDYMCVLDIQSAYRAVPINPDHRRYQGFSWRWEGEARYFTDNRMCFGLRCAPYYFHLISQFIYYIFATGFGLKAVNYADDFLIMSGSYNQSLVDQSCAVSAIRYLGFSVAWAKLSPPSTVAVYLGIEIDSLNMELRLPSDKLSKLCSLLENLRDRHKISRKDLQSLTGLLAHCATVVRGGRSFCRRLYDLDKCAALNQLKHVSLSIEAKRDIEWWHDFVHVFNGNSTIKKIPCVYSVVSDSSLRGYAAHFDKDWLIGSWTQDLTLDTPCCHAVPRPALNDFDIVNINVLELYPVLCALKRWPEFFRGLGIEIVTDNNQVMFMLRTGRSSNKQCMEWIREIFWLSATYDFDITATYIQSSANVLADTLSRVLYPATSNELLSTLERFDICCNQHLVDFSRQFHAKDSGPSGSKA